MSRSRLNGLGLAQRDSYTPKCTRLNCVLAQQSCPLGLADRRPALIIMTKMTMMMAVVLVMMVMVVEVLHLRLPTFLASGVWAADLPQRHRFQIQLDSSRKLALLPWMDFKTMKKESSNQANNLTKKERRKKPWSLALFWVGPHHPLSLTLPLFPQRAEPEMFNYFPFSTSNRILLKMPDLLISWRCILLYSNWNSSFQSRFQPAVPTLSVFLYIWKYWQRCRGWMGGQRVWGGEERYPGEC